MMEEIDILLNLDSKKRKVEFVDFSDFPWFDLEGPMRYAIGDMGWSDKKPLELIISGTCWRNSINIRCCWVL
jgi:hypothetical protein